MAINGKRLLHRFLDGRSPLTIIAYTRDLNDFRTRLRVDSAAEAIERLFGSSHSRAQAILADYLASMRKRGLAPATINRRLAMLRSLGKNARIFGVVDWAIEASNVRAEKVRDTTGPGRANVLKMVKHLKTLPATKESLRDLAIIRLAYDLGLRRAEICEVNVSDLLDDGLRVRRKGKQSKQTLGLPEPTRDALKAWLGVRGAHPGACFINFDSIHRTKSGKRLSGSAVYGIVRRRATEAGVTVPVRPHGIRHTAITEARIAAARRGYGLDRLVDFSGHSEVRTLKHYLDEVDSAQAELSRDIALPK